MCLSWKIQCRGKVLAKWWQQNSGIAEDPCKRFALREGDSENEQERECVRERERAWNRVRERERERRVISSTSETLLELISYNKYTQTHTHTHTHTHTQWIYLLFTQLSLAMMYWLCAQTWSKTRLVNTRSCIANFCSLGCEPLGPRTLSVPQKGLFTTQVSPSLRPQLHVKR